MTCEYILCSIKPFPAAKDRWPVGVEDWIFGSRIQREAAVGAAGRVLSGRMGVLMLHCSVQR